MTRFRLTVRRTEISTEIVELDAVNMRDAAIRGDRYLDGQRRGVQVVRPYDEDKDASDTVEIIAVKEL
jgi:hypothetical protein